MGELGALRCYFHGTTGMSARDLLAGASLDSNTAMDRSVGSGTGSFYLATELDDAIYLGSLHGTSLVVLRVDLDVDAVTLLVAKGCRTQAIPQAGARVPFKGDELVIVPAAFAAFNALREQGRIVFDEQPID